MMEEKTKKRKKKRKAEVAADARDGHAKKKQKKAYELPGQKHDRPDERDPLRIFYETLYEQLPNSDMASVWMMEWGLLPHDEAQKVYRRMMKKNKQQASLSLNSVSFKKAKFEISPSGTVEVTKTTILSKSSKKKDIQK